MMQVRAGTKIRNVIDIRHHFIQYKIFKYKMKVRHVPDAQQKADNFTKPLRRLEFNRQKYLIGVQDLEPFGRGACETRKRLPGGKIT